MKKKIALSLVGIFLTGMLFGAFIVYAQTGPQKQVISAGRVPGAPTYTLSYDTGSYYAKNSWGTIIFSGTNGRTVGQNALDLLMESGGGELKISGSVNLGTDALDLHTAAVDAVVNHNIAIQTSIKLSGESTVGDNRTTPTLHFSGNAAINSSQGNYGVQIENLAITSDVAGHGTGINQSWGQEWSLNNVKIQNCLYGIYLSNVADFSAYKTRLTGNTYAVFVPSSVFANRISFYETYFSHSTGDYAVRISSGSEDLLFSGCTWEYNAYGSAYIRGGAPVTFFSCHEELNSQTAGSVQFKFDAYATVNIEGCDFKGSNKNLDVVYADNPTYHLRIDSSLIGYPFGSMTRSIYSDAKNTELSNLHLFNNVKVDGDCTSFTYNNLVFDGGGALTDLAVIHEAFGKSKVGEEGLWINTGCPIMNAAIMLTTNISYVIPSAIPLSGNTFELHLWNTKTNVTYSGFLTLYWHVKDLT